MLRPVLAENVKLRLSFNHVMSGRLKSPQNRNIQSGFSVMTDLTAEK